MKKIVFLILIIAFISVLPIFAQQQEMAFGPFDSALSGAGLILEATGFGLVVGGGATASLDLGAALIMMQIAPVCSTTGAWCTQAFMEQTAAEWEAKGLNFDSTEYIDSSRSAAIGTTVFAAGSAVNALDSRCWKLCLSRMYRSCGNMGHDRLLRIKAGLVHGYKSGDCDIRNGILILIGSIA